MSNLTTAPVQVELSEINNAFRSLVNGNTHIGSHGTAGTNHILRSGIWDNFRHAYPANVTIKLRGITIKLQADHSISGKSTSYFSFLTRDEYVALNLSDFGLKKDLSAYISIDGGTIKVCGGGNHYIYIQNKEVEEIF
jgi:hypothetical protein